MIQTMQIKPRHRVLLASIHDVAPPFETQVDRLTDLLSRNTGQARFAMLVVPDYWGNAPISEYKQFQARLRGWSDSGIEMFLHGWYHRDDHLHAMNLTGFKARFMTAGEGEFSALEHSEAVRRITDGRKLLEDIIGREITGFVAPAWLYSDASKDALRECDIALAEDHFRVWQPNTGRVLVRGPVITWASRSRSRVASSLAVAALARRLHVFQRVLRIAVHPGDTTIPNILKSIEDTLTAIGRKRRIAKYCELMSG